MINLVSHELDSHNDVHVHFAGLWLSILRRPTGVSIVTIRAHSSYHALMTGSEFYRPSTELSDNHESRSAKGGKGTFSLLGVSVGDAC